MTRLISRRVAYGSGFGTSQLLCLGFCLRVNGGHGLDCRQPLYLHTHTHKYIYIYMYIYIYVYIYVYIYIYICICRQIWLFL